MIVQQLEVVVAGEGDATRLHLFLVGAVDPLSLNAVEDPLADMTHGVRLLLPGHRLTLVAADRAAQVDGLGTTVGPEVGLQLAGATANDALSAHACRRRRRHGIRGTLTEHGDSGGCGGVQARLGYGTSWGRKQPHRPLLLTPSRVGRSLVAIDPVGGVGLVVLENEVGGVGGHNPVFLAESHDLVLQLILFALQADRIEQVADATGGPQAGNERVVAIGGLEVTFVDEFTLLALDITE